MRGSVRQSMILLFAGCLFSSMGSSSLGVYPNAYIQLYNENQSLFMKTEQCGEVQYTIGLLTAELSKMPSHSRHDRIREAFKTIQAIVVVEITQHHSLCAFGQFAQQCISIAVFH